MGPEPAAPLPAQDLARPWRVAAGLFAVLAVFGLAVWLSRVLQVRSEHGAAAVTPALGQPEIATVNQAPFDLDLRARAELKRRRERLERFGWVDRDAGLAHLPLDVAFDLVLAGEGRDGGSP